MKECVTHYYACDCREKMMKKVCKGVLKDHDELAKFKSGFGPYRKCKCDLCRTARKLYPELETT